LVARFERASVFELADRVEQVTAWPDACGLVNPLVDVREIVGYIRRRNVGMTNAW